MNNKLLPLLLCVLWCSCSTDTPKAETQDQSLLAQLGTQYLEHYNTHHWEELALLFAPNVELRLPLQEEGAVSLSQVDLVPILQNLERAYPDIRDSLVASHVSDNCLILELVGMGISPTGDTLHEHSCKVLEVDSTGHIIREYNY